MSIQITTEQIKELRDMTGISVMQCKHALEEAEGDINKALAILKKTSSDIASKKLSREVKDGRVSIKINGNKAVLVSLLCETDFVARNEDFKNLLEILLNDTLEKGVAAMKEGAKEKIDQIIQKTGENIQLGEVLEITGNVLGSYIHNDKIGVIVSLEDGNQELAKDIAMHITAMKPEYISESDITDEAKNMMREVFEKEVADIDKPAPIKERILLGKISTYFKEKTLVDQAFIKDPEKTIAKLLEEAKATIKEVKKYAI